MNKGYIEKLIYRKLKTFVTKTLLRILLQTEDELLAPKIVYQMVEWISWLRISYMLKSNSISVKRLNKFIKRLFYKGNSSILSLAVVFTYHPVNSSRLLTLSVHMYSDWANVIYSFRGGVVGNIDNLLWFYPYKRSKTSMEITFAYYLSLLKAYFACRVSSVLPIRFSIDRNCSPDHLEVYAIVGNISGDSVIKLSPTVLAYMLTLAFAFRSIWLFESRFIYVGDIEPSRRICYISSKSAKGGVNNESN